MGVAYAAIADGRITVRTEARGEEFYELLVACKQVPGGRFSPVHKMWHYPLSIDTCRALRRAFGERLRVHSELGSWYRDEATVAAQQVELGGATEAALPEVSAAYASFGQWLRGYQRAGARWSAQLYRNAGLVADDPGLGKTPQTLASLVEAEIAGPVLVICPKASVRLVWGHELETHVPDVPRYLCYGSRAKRQATLKKFANDIHRDSNTLRVVVIVAEMLRVEMGDPCYTEGGNKISGMCPQRMRSMTMECTLHTQRPAEKAKDKVPVDFSYPQLFDQYLLGGGWAQVIIDESHKLLGSLTVVKGNLMGKGLKYLPERTGRRLALSGTPFGRAGRTEGLFGTLHWLWPDEYTSYWKWVGDKFEVEEKIVNRRGLKVKKVHGLKGLARDASAQDERQAYERFIVELGPRVLRRTKGEALTNLPPKVYAEQVCGMTRAQAKQYRQMMEFAEVVTAGGPVMANGALALLTRTRQIANGVITLGPDGKVQFTGDSGKLERLWANLEARGILEGTPGSKIVVASAFNEYLDAIAARLQEAGVGFLRYDGRMSQMARDMVVRSWQLHTVTQENRVLLLNATAGGVSITLDAADEMHIMDELPDPGANQQLEDRLHRASRNHSVTIFYYRTEGTIDYKKAHDVEFRRQAQHAVLDGSRGVEYVRTMLNEAFDEEMEYED
jgi:SNF2 family DNA or RNA helicase